MIPDNLLKGADFDIDYVPDWWIEAHIPQKDRERFLMEMYEMERHESYPEEIYEMQDN